MWDKIKVTPTRTVTANISLEEMQNIIDEAMALATTSPHWKEGQECVLPFKNKETAYKVVLCHMGDRIEAWIGRESEFTTTDNGNFSIEA